MPTESGSIFLDPALDKEFAIRGYVLTPLLTRDAVQSLLEVRRNKVREVPRDYYATLFDPDVHYRREIQRAIDVIVAPSVRPFLKGYQSCSSAFIDKRANTEKGRVQIHQDYTFVDQSRHAGVHVWIPLVDVNEDNGCLQAFPGTHSLVNHVSTIPPGPSPYDGVKALIESDCGIRVPMAAGMGLFYNERLLHSSEDNRTAAERPAVACACIPQGFKVRLYVRRGGSPTAVDVMEVDDFLDVHTANLQLNILNPGGVRRIGAEEHVVRFLEPDDIRHLRIGRNGPPPGEIQRGASWLSRLFGAGERLIRG